MINGKSALSKIIFNIAVFSTITLVSCSGGSVSVSTTFSSPQNNDKSPLGTNLSEVRDYTSEWVFVDLMKQARPWRPQRPGFPSGQGWPLALDSNGWITSLDVDQTADLLMQWGIPGTIAETGFVVLYDGEGTLKLSGTAKQTSATPGRIVFDVVPFGSSGIALTLSATNPSNYVRNIRVIRPGFESTYTTEPFHPLFLSRLVPFKVLRFMDWQKTNDNPLANWADRTTPTTYTQADGIKGVALEYQIMLANTLNADAWFNIPVNATDDFVLQFATMVKAQLKPNLKAYVEYSNEAWNGIFSQTFVLQNIGQGVKPPIGGSPPDSFPLGGSAFVSGLRYYSWRAVEIFDIFSSVFVGDTARLVRVMGGQAGSYWNGTQTLAFHDAYLKTDAYTIAPYFAGDLGTQATATIEAMSVTNVLEWCENYVANTGRTRIQDHITMLKAYGLPLIAYEGGQHLVGVGAANVNSTIITDVFIAANRDPRMGNLYKTWLDTWKAEGGGMFVNFTSVYGYSKFGSWGLLEYQNQDLATAYKYKAEMEWIKNNPL